MQRLSVFGVIALVVLVGLAAIGVNRGGVTAQEGTPGPGETEFAPGVFVAPLAVAERQEIPALYRLRFAPGSVLFADTSDPSVSLVYVETGTISISIKAPVAVTRAGAIGRSPEIVVTETAILLRAGEYLVVPSFAEGTYRNEGQEVTSLLVSAIVPSKMANPMVGTPAP